MAIFKPIRDYFHRRQAKILNELASGVHLTNRLQESLPGNFVFPATDFVDDIEVDGQRLGQIVYGINSLNDLVYVSNINIERNYRLHGLGTAALWSLCCNCQVLLVPMHEVGTAVEFWSKARKAGQQP